MNVCMYLCACGCASVPSCVILHLLFGYMRQCTFLFVIVCVYVCVCVCVCVPVHTQTHFTVLSYHHVVLVLEGNLSQGSLCGGQADWLEQALFTSTVQKALYSGQSPFSVILKSCWPTDHGKSVPTYHTLSHIVSCLFLYVHIHVMVDVVFVSWLQCSTLSL